MDILSYVMGLKAGEASGGGGTNIDLPIFTATFDEDWETLQSFTCNKTFQECFECLERGASAAIELETNGTVTYTGTAIEYEAEEGEYIKYVGCPSATVDIVYTPEGIEFVAPSGYPDELTATENGEYEADTVYKTVTVAVP